VGEKREEEIDPHTTACDTGYRTGQPDCPGAERAFGGFVPKYLAYRALYACG
jgi:hypothetical protein